ncbi:MAG: phenylpyruvate tautomerase MIF-related protein [Gammaproteobacteria bacterium]|nr:phenylpyruvate tautomerase MIF-related protein [Gammaproteobacteria bacterium]
MPLLQITTNEPINPAEEADFLASASRTVAEILNKPEQYVMVSLAHNPHMIFAGSRDPAAYLELKSIGLPENRAANFSAALAGLINRETGIPATRIYIEFTNAPRQLWGWNGETF